MRLACKLPQGKTDDHSNKYQEGKGDYPGHADRPEKDLEGHYLHVLNQEHSAQEKKYYDYPRFWLHNNTPEIQLRAENGKWIINAQFFIQMFLFSIFYSPFSVFQFQLSILI
jgi:hypothetical protein